MIIKSHLISSRLTLDSLLGGLGGFSALFSSAEACLVTTTGWSNDLTFLTNLLSLFLSTRGVPSQRKDGLVGCRLSGSPTSEEAADEAEEEKSVSGWLSGASSLEYSFPWCCMDEA